MAPEAGYSGAALAQLQCANGAVWALYSGLDGVASGQAPWFAYHGNYPGRWRPVFEEQYIEGSTLTIRAPAEAPAGYPGPFSATSSSSAVFVGEDSVAEPPAAVVELATDAGATLSSLGSVSGIIVPTGVAFLSSRVGWLVGRRANHRHMLRSDRTGLSLVDRRDEDGGQTWVTQMIYTP
jgi:hypothetical protein